MINNLFGLPVIPLNKCPLEKLLLDVSKELSPYEVNCTIDNSDFCETLFSASPARDSKNPLYSLQVCTYGRVSSHIVIPTTHKKTIIKKIFKELIRPSSDYLYKDLRVAAACLIKCLQEVRLNPAKFIIHLNKMYCLPDQRYTGVYAEKEDRFGFTLHLPHIKSAILEEGWDYEDAQWKPPQA